MLLCDAYDEEQVAEKGNEEDIRTELKEDFATDYDQSGAIGRRYRRQDEAGTPFCVTVDYQSKEDKTGTLRFRDSMEQIRLPIAEIAARLHQEIKAYKRIK
jgi:glycyl-tRNA synthetase